ncbi:MAG: CCA tRNA nucleotidyltransferase [Acidobacteriaceae bacterium]|nr:CCA tRNA nucleotidyltransferase [Acidobacteriaceae bacterium]
MADYIYLLETRLSQAQQSALSKIREIARNKELTVFLVGGAVRDLTNGSPVRDLDVVVQGNALKLKKDIEKAGGKISGESEPVRALYVSFPGGVRVEVGSTLTVSWPKPGKPVYESASILDDLRRRDFTANSMALSLNEGSFALLMDPLNGVADIENRELRLVSNYGFIEDPVRMIRAVRFMSRLGWQMDERTRARYQSAKEEGSISAMSAPQRVYEMEEIFHEEDPLRVLRHLEAEGWMKHLNQGVSSARVNVGELERLQQTQAQLHMQGVDAELSAASFPLLTAKMAPRDVTALKKSFTRRVFVAEIESLDKEAKEFVTRLTSKEAALPSQAWKLIYNAKPEVVLWAAYTGKSAAVQGKFKAFYTEWPQARHKIPYAQMLEMRITPEVAGYDELLDKLFFALMDGKLGTVEELKTFLEPYSPPAPPPPTHLRRAKPKKEAKAKSKKKAAAEAGAVTEAVAVAQDAKSPAQPEQAKAEKKPAAKPVKKAEAAKAPVAKKVPAKAEKKPAVPAKPAKKPVTVKAKAPAAKKAPAKAAVKKPAPAVKKAPAKAPARKVVAKKPAPKAPAKAAPKKPAPKKSTPAKKAPAKKSGAKKR